jgi:hypothetical protein
MANLASAFQVVEAKWLQASRHAAAPKPKRPETTRNDLPTNRSQVTLLQGDHSASICSNKCFFAQQHRA